MLFIRKRVVTGFGGPKIAILMEKIDFQGWDPLFLEDDTQCKFERPENYEFFTNGSSNGNVFTTTILEVSIHLIIEDITRILDIPLGGWDHYVKFEWPPSDNMAKALSIINIIFGNPNLLQHHYVFKREMFPLH